MADQPAPESSDNVYSRLLRDRIIYLGTQIDDNVANLIFAQLLFLSSNDSERDIKMYINSPGGTVASSLGIYDVMQHIPCNVQTFCVGLAGGTAAILLAAGATGKRYILYNAEVLLTRTTPRDKADLELASKRDHLLKTHRRLVGILAHHTGQPHERIEADTYGDDFWMTAREVVAYGIADHVLGSGVLQSTNTPSESSPVNTRETRHPAADEAAIAHYLASQQKRYLSDRPKNPLGPRYPGEVWRRDPSDPIAGPYEVTVRDALNGPPLPGEYTVNPDPASPLFPGQIRPFPPFPRKG